MRLYSLLNWVLPVSCLLCGKVKAASQANICRPCAQDLPIIPYPCYQCGLPLPTTALSPASLCGQCIKHPPLYDRLHAQWSYQFPINQIILRLKFGQDLKYARLLGELIAEYNADYYTTGVERPSILIPVPLHYKRLRARGFNQAVEIAKPLGRKWNIPIHYNAIKRIRHTKPQMELSLAERKENIGEAFAVSKKSLPTHVAIVDDVVTSGHTINAICALLRASGVKYIEVWCAARAISF